MNQVHNEFESPRAQQLHIPTETPAVEEALPFRARAF